MKSNIDNVLNIAKIVVEQKKLDGTYPPGLEQELEYEFANLLSKALGGTESELASLTHLIIDRLAVVDHLAMMIVELEHRIQELESKASVDDN